MPNYLKIITLNEQGVSQRQISKLTHTSRDVIREITRSAQQHQISSEQLINLNDDEIEKVLEVHFSDQRQPNQLYEMPDYEYYARELKKPGVTMMLLWEEYVQQCKRNGKVPYQKTQFKKYFHDHITENEFTDIIKHKPGETIEVDWSGTRPYWTDPDTGEKVEGYLFVGVLSYSGYGYAEVTADMKTEAWIITLKIVFSMLKGPRFSHLGPFIFLSLVHQLLHQLEIHWSTNLPTNFSGVPTNYFREPFFISTIIKHI